MTKQKICLNYGNSYGSDEMKNKTLLRRKLVHISKKVEKIYEWEFGKWPFYRKGDYYDCLYKEYERLRIELRDSDSRWWDAYEARFTHGFKKIVLPFCGED